MACSNWTARAKASLGSLAISRLQAAPSTLRATMIAVAQPREVSWRRGKSDVAFYRIGERLSAPDYGFRVSDQLGSDHFCKVVERVHKGIKNLELRIENSRFLILGSSF